MSKFSFEPASFIPFRDKKAIEKCRAIKREDFEKHKNPDYRIQVVPDDMIETIFLADMFYRVKTARDEGRNCVLITPNPNHTYIKLAYLINKFNIPCDHLYTFNMDEYADQDGNIAPESYAQGFLRSTKAYLYKNIREDLRPPENHIVGLTNKNIDRYNDLIQEKGGADACYSGPGWSGHLAFIEPDAPEFDADLATWKKMGARVVTLGPLTIAQNSLHASFGYSGDLAFVPPKAATIGPKEVLAAKYRLDMHALTTFGTKISWQRMTSRLCIHGPVTPRLPTSILQTVPTDVIVSESAAANIEPDYTFGY